MKSIVKYTVAAAMVAGSAASHHHLHQHRHVKAGGSRVEKREPDMVTEIVAGPTETVYQLGGELLDAEKAQAGLDGGDYVVVGESTPTYSPPPPPPAPTTTSKSKQNLGAQFMEKPTSKPSPPPPPPTTSAAPESTSTPPPPPPKSTTSSSSDPGSDSGSGSDPISSGTGLNAKFPSGKIKCSEFPSKYGAIPLDWMNLGGWSGVQKVPGFHIGALSISKIITAISGQSCTSGAMCSYSCPTGYQKTQWPDAQGSTKQSVGGLYCNNDGYLELTRKNSDKLCESGAGGVSIKNELSSVVSTCRTDYPGTEAMVLPSVAQPGSSVSVCNPDQSNYYVWDGMSTSAQYYINKKGLEVEDACVWNSPKDKSGAGNWAPMILGVGKAKDGITYISLFDNAPTSTAKLNFNVEITGDVNSKCAFVNGQYKGGSTGCTTGMKPGGRAVIRYF